MAKGKCPGCPEVGKYELVENTPKNAEYKLYLICCRACGTVVGTTDFYNAGVLARAIATKLGIKLT